MNKVNTKAEVRVDLDAAEDWLPREVRERLETAERGRLNKRGHLIVRSDEKRTQRQNVDLCFSKLKRLVDAASVEPKEREQWTGIGDVTKKKRKDFKRRRSEVKAARRNHRRDDDW